MGKGDEKVREEKKSLLPDICCRRFFNRGGAQPSAILMECPCAGARVVGKIFKRQIVSTVAMAPERLCDDCNTTGVRHSRWMGHWN